MGVDHRLVWHGHLQGMACAWRGLSRLDVIEENSTAQMSCKMCGWIIPNETGDSVDHSSFPIQDDLTAVREYVTSICAR